MATFIMIAIFICLILFLINWYYMYRNNRVLDLLLELIDSLYYTEYEKLPSYNKLWLCFWLPLNKKYWIKKINKEK